ncbi:hypothetical protein NFJ02_03g101880 [Pycnococcus provasolii]
MEAALRQYDAASSPAELLAASALLANAVRAHLKGKAPLAPSSLPPREMLAVAAAPHCALVLNSEETPLGGKVLRILLENDLANWSRNDLAMVSQTLSLKDIARLTAVEKSLRALANQVLEVFKWHRGFEEFDPLFEPAMYAPFPEHWKSSSNVKPGRYEIYAACLQNVWNLGDYCLDVDDFLTYPASGVLVVDRNDKKVRLDQISCHLFEQTCKALMQYDGPHHYGYSDEEFWVDDEDEDEDDSTLHVHPKGYFKWFVSCEEDSGWISGRRPQWGQRPRQRARLARLSQSPPDKVVMPFISLTTNEKFKALTRVRSASMERKPDDDDDELPDDEPAYPMAEASEFNFHLEEMATERVGRVEVGDVIMQLAFYHEPDPTYECEDPVRLSFFARPSPQKN